MLLRNIEYVRNFFFKKFHWRLFVGAVQQAHIFLNASFTQKITTDTTGFTLGLLTASPCRRVLFWWASQIGGVTGVWQVSDLYSNSHMYIRRRKFINPKMKSIQSGDYFCFLFNVVLISPNGIHFFLSVMILLRV